MGVITTTDLLSYPKWEDIHGIMITIKLPSKPFQVLIDIYYKFCCPEVKQSIFDGASYGTSLPSVGRHTLSTIQLLVKLLYHLCK